MIRENGQEYISIYINKWLSYIFSLKKYKLSYGIFSEKKEFLWLRDIKQIRATCEEQERYFGFRVYLQSAFNQ